MQPCSCATQPRGTMLPCHALPCSHAMSPCHAGWPCRTAVPCSHAVGGTGGQVERGGGRADLPRGRGSCGCLGWGVLGCHWERRRLRKPAAPSVCCRGCRQGWVEGEPLVWGAGGVVAFLAPGRFAGSCPPDFPSTWVCLGPPVPALCVRVTPKSPGSQVTWRPLDTHVPWMCRCAPTSPCPLAPLPHGHTPRPPFQPPESRGSCKDKPQSSPRAESPFQRLQKQTCKGRETRGAHQFLGCTRRRWVSWRGHPAPHHGTSQTAKAKPRGAKSCLSSSPRSSSAGGI